MEALDYLVLLQELQHIMPEVVVVGDIPLVVVVAPAAMAAAAPAQVIHRHYLHQALQILAAAAVAGQKIIILLETIQLVLVNPAVPAS
jgi:hypothetical protein